MQTGRSAQNIDPRGSNDDGEDDDGDEDEEGDALMARNGSVRPLKSATTAKKGAKKATASSTNKPSSSSRKRKRVSRACDSCYVHKDKCDGASPSCSICARLSRSCTYTRPEKKRGPQQGVRGRLEAQCAALETVLGWILHCAQVEFRSLDAQASVSSAGGNKIGRTVGAAVEDVRPGTVLRLLLQPSLVAASALWSSSFAFPPPSSSLHILAQHWRTSVLATYLTSPLAPSSPGLAIGLEGAASVADGFDAELASRQAGGEVGILGDSPRSAGGGDDDDEDEDDNDADRNHTEALASPVVGGGAADGVRRRGLSQSESTTSIGSSSRPAKAPPAPAPGKTRRTIDPAPTIRKPAPNPAGAHPPVSRGPPPPCPARPDDGLSIGTLPEALNGSDGQRLEPVIEPGADVWARPIATHNNSNHTRFSMDARDAFHTRSSTDARDAFALPSSNSAWKSHGHQHSHESLPTRSESMGGPSDWSRAFSTANERSGVVLSHHASEVGPRQEYQHQHQHPQSLYPSAEHAVATSSPTTHTFSEAHPTHEAHQNAWAPVTSATHLSGGNDYLFGNTLPPSFYLDSPESFSFTDPDAQALLYALGLSAATMNGGGEAASGHEVVVNSAPQAMTGTTGTAGLSSSYAGTSAPNSNLDAVAASTVHGHGRLGVGSGMQRQARSSTESAASPASCWEEVTGGGGPLLASSMRKAPTATTGTMSSSAENAAHASILFQLGLQEDAYSRGVAFPFGNWFSGGGGETLDSASVPPSANVLTSDGHKNSAVLEPGPTPTSSAGPGQHHPPRSPGKSMTASLRTLLSPRRGEGSLPVSSPSDQLLLRGGGGGGGAAAPALAGRMRASSGPGPPDVSGTLRQFQLQAAELIRRDTRAFGPGSGSR
ncbi:unnamed protein product [Tilletia controversa]|uniref:Zn(2)-C6 fungal-type domain-containing protein n=1 Tax=Tilletia controversa TaxID=13291 RepID=A0A8X7N0C5_9BASI|nr:hypothetical protein CF328_g6947 [Tilletia controversa]KAE8254205.1 hypothetical protein A4X06_0g1014 [Tilletia controversa]CAD6908661.1 unnamed protein product [Tilletia controversa]CAD6940452.1 unnamed protein product [Tilletia controversa]CAD6968723.1 unnamed protein product [Tilletia controversa]